MFAMSGARVFDGERFHDDVAVVIEGQRVKTLVPVRDVPANVSVRTLDGGILAPGFIDVQANGGGGVLFNSSPTVDSMRLVADAHRQFGTTGILPTVITDDEAVLAQGRAAAQVAASSVPMVLGLHQEGPFLDEKRKGAHAAYFIRPLTDTDVDALCAYRGGVLMVTLAPNMADPMRVARLAARGVRVSLGHSDASFESVEAACAAGASAFTHVFNAMSQMTARDPGMVGAAFAIKNTYCGIIADGHHVAWPNVQSLIAARGADRVMLVTDAMPSAAGGPDQFSLQGRRVRRADGRLTLDDGTLAGSDLTMDVAVRNCIAHAGVSVEDGLRMASRTPAEFLGRTDIGIISPGALARLVHLDDELRVRATWVDGGRQDHISFI